MKKAWTWIGFVLSITGGIIILLFAILMRRELTDDEIEIFGDHFATKYLSGKCGRN